jgi:hypothetical protein
MNTRTASLLLAALLPGCAAYKIEPPPGFAVVSEHDWETRMKAQDNVGLSVRRFDNVKGGTLSFWGADLVKKLGNRGYVLKAQSAIKTGNGKTGTRFDFDYVTYDTEIPKFYTVVLVVTDKHKIVLQVAGGREHVGEYTPRIPEMLGSLKVRGCKPGSKICGGAQPPPQSTPVANKPAELAIPETPAPTTPTGPAAAPPKP